MTMSIPDGPTLKVSDVAKRWSVNTKTVRKWANVGALQCVRLGQGCDSSDGVRPLVRFRWSVVLQFEREQLGITS